MGVAIGDSVLDVAPVADDLRPPLRDLFAGPTLNRFLAAGPGIWRETRERLTDWLTRPAHRAVVEPHLVPLGGLRLHLPFEVADYVDFYASRNHAENVGRLFRPGQPPLHPNWVHMPVGYHGRSGSVVVSGTPVTRPSGQRREPGEAGPVFGPSVRLDFEAEVGFVVGVPSAHGQPVPLGEFPEHVFGACLVNDWSARDIQSFETVPLGPFLGKAFATSVSPWVVPLAALGDARVAPPPRDPAPLPYLRDDADPWGLDLNLTVRINGNLVSEPPFATMYWTPAQMLAHLTCGGAPLRTGDLYASGTVSGPGTRSARLPARTDPGRRRAAGPARRHPARVPRRRRRGRHRGDRPRPRRRTHQLRRGPRPRAPGASFRSRQRAARRSAMIWCTALRPGMPVTPPPPWVPDPAW